MTSRSSSVPSLQCCAATAPANSDLQFEPDARPVVSGIDFRSVYSSTPGNAVYNRDFDATVAEFVERLPAGATVAEYGAGANPLLAALPRIASGELKYLRVDISETELNKSDAPGDPVVADVCAPDFVLPVPADFAVSRMLAEHVPSGQAFLRNVHANLAEGGVYAQLSPVLWALPFTVNRILPETAADKALYLARPGRDRFQRAKFPARYSLCRPPSQRHIRRLTSLGFHLDAARGYFGHNYYRRVPPLHAFERAKSAWLAEHPKVLDCSFAIYVLSRPARLSSKP